VPINEVVAMLYRDVLRTNFVMPPAVYEDQRRVSLRIHAPLATARQEADRYLAALGYRARRMDGVDHLELRPEPRFPFVYRPRYRDSAYLTRTAQQFVGRDGADSSGGGLSVSGGSPVGAPGGSGKALGGPVDAVVLYVTERERGILSAVLPTIDTPGGEVSIDATVFEVASTSDAGSAIRLASTLASKRLGVTLDTAGAGVGGASIRLGGGDFNGVVEALSSDSRFRIVTRPNVRVASGAEARFTSGEQVPVLGAVSYAGAAAQPVQSVEYRDSGVVFRVKPTVLQRQITVEFSQEISSFAATTTGVNASPTLNKRSVDSVLTMQDDETILVGGLSSTKSASGSRGILGIPLEWTGGDAATEILVLLHVRLTPESRGRAVAKVASPPARGRIVRKDSGKYSQV
jgi:membrane-bound inhibitor of C-type lysozyme